MLPVVTDGIPKGKETAGLFAVMMEAGLAGISEVVPRVGARGPAPGLVIPRGTEVDAWVGTLGIAAGTPSTQLRLSIELCGGGDRCELLEANAPFQEIPEAVGALLSQVSMVLERRAAATTVESWARPLSTDAYALLMTGRAGANFYGLGDPTPEARWGDRKLDPMTRAGYLDPGIPLGFWLAGRRALGAGKEARLPFAQAALAGPASPAMLVAEASSLMDAGKHRDALVRFDALAELLPNDPRFLRDHARAALAVDDLALAQSVLRAAPLSIAETRDLLALRVQVAETAMPSELDALLQTWQERVLDDPEPVRRRVENRVRDGRWQEALDLLPALTERGVDSGALEVALRAAAGHGTEGGAPAIQDLRAALDAADAALSLTAERARALGALQNSLVTPGSPRLEGLCAGERLEAARAENAAGPEWRAALLDSDSRVRLARTLASEASVAPLLSGAESVRIRRLEELVTTETRRYDLGRAWHRSWVSPALARCG